MYGGENMKKRRIGLVVVCMFLFFIIGISYVYAQNINTATNVVTIGHVEIALHNEDDEAVNNGSRKILPGDTIGKKVTVENIGDYATYIRVKVKKEWVGAIGLSGEEICIHPVEGWTKGTALEAEDGFEYYYYKNIVGSGDSVIFMENYTLDANLFTNEDMVKNQNAKGKITIDAEAVQADYYSPTYVNGNVVAWPNIAFGEGYVNQVPNQTVVTQSAVTGSGVEFVGNSGSFVSFDKNQGGTDLFLSVKGLMPGQSVTQTIDITNTLSEPIEVFMYAKIPEDILRIARMDSEYELLTSLTLTVESTAVGKIIYHGPLFEHNDSKDMLSAERAISLGIFQPGKYEHLIASVELPGSWSKAYCQTRVDWVFTTERLGGSTTPPDSEPNEGGQGTIATGNPPRQPGIYEDATPTVSFTPSVSASATVEPTNNVIQETNAPNEEKPTPTSGIIETEIPLPTEKVEEETPKPTVVSNWEMATHTITLTPKPSKRPNPQIPEQFPTKTGDSAPIVFWSVLAIVSLVGCIWSIRRICRRG